MTWPPVRRRPMWSSPATTRSACRTRPSSASSPGWPCRPRTAGSTCTSPRNGLHVDRDQIAASLGLPDDKVRLHLAGVGGAFGAREDLSMQVHAVACSRCTPTARCGWSTTGRSRSSATSTGTRRSCTTSTAPTPTVGSCTCGRRSCSTAAPTPRARRRWRPTRPRSASVPTTCANVEIDSWAVYTNNPPCGAMRGFGAVQACFAYESQMDRLAARPGPRPDRAAHPQRHGRGLDDAAPARWSTRPHPWPSCSGGSATSRCRSTAGRAISTTSTCATSPAAWPTRPTARASSGASATASASRTSCFSAGFDDPFTARVRLEVVAGEPVVSVHTAAAEVGQGMVTVQAQVARTELGVDQVVVLPADTDASATPGRPRRRARPT